ncbi:MAG TPA: CrcB family protein [Polyangia bacterium]|nr:CrcB family protein [Polyangia bacterium]
MRLALVCLGGAFGSGARFLLAEWIGKAAGPGLPWGTWAVNVIGCFAIELVVLAGAREHLSSTAVLTLTTGVLGGFTTYSAFNNQTLALLRGGGLGGVLYVAATLLGCALSGLCGWALGNAVFGRS